MQDWTLRLGKAYTRSITLSYWHRYYLEGSGNVGETEKEQLWNRKKSISVWKGV